MTSGRDRPGRMCIGPESAESFAADEMTFCVEDVVDGGVMDGETANAPPAIWVSSFAAALLPLCA